MAGFIPAPAKPASVGFLNQPQVPIPAGGLTIVTGLALAGLTDLTRGRLQLDSARVESPEAIHHYRPGTIAAGTLCKWGNLRANRTARVVGMEVNLETAPASGDGANFHSLRVTDAFGAVGTLPIGTVGSTYYRLDLGATGSQKFATHGLAMGTSTLSQTAHVIRFSPTQDITLTGVQFPFIATCGKATVGAAGSYRFGVQGGGVNYEADVRCVLLDDAGNELAGATRFVVPRTATGGAPADNVESFVWPAAVVLTAGKTYAVGVHLQTLPGWISGSGWDSTTRPKFETGGDNSAVGGQPLSAVSSSRILRSPLAASSDYLSGAAKLAPVVWADAYKAGSAWVDPGGAGFMRLVGLGDGGGIPTRGDLTFDLTATGTAPLTPGSGLNARILLALGQ